jgi:hypothetical protein
MTCTYNDMGYFDIIHQAVHMELMSSLFFYLYLTKKEKKIFNFQKTHQNRIEGDLCNFQCCYNMTIRNKAMTQPILVSFIIIFIHIRTYIYIFIYI